MNDADLLPHYFLFNVPRSVNEGVLTLERFGQSGVTGVLEKDLAGFFRARFPDHRLHILPLVPAKLLDGFLRRGRLLRIRFIRFGIPNDVADRYDKGHEEVEGTTELRVTANRGNSLPLLGAVRDFLSGRSDLRKFIELRQFPYDALKIELELGGKRRTIDLGTPGNIRATTDISEQVAVGKDGHPEFESIDAIARELINEIVESLDGG